MNDQDTKKIYCPKCGEGFEPRELKPSDPSGKILAAVFLPPLFALVILVVCAIGRGIYHVIEGTRYPGIFQ